MSAGSGPAIFPLPPEIRRVYVIAGNYREFIHWCQDNRLNRMDPKVRYIQDFTRLHGVMIEENQGDRVVLYGTYQGRMDWAEMIERLMICWRK